MKRREKNERRRTKRGEGGNEKEKEKKPKGRERVRTRKILCQNFEAFITNFISPKSVVVVGRR